MRSNSPWLTHIPQGADPMWLTGKGQLIPLSQMDNDHLLNIERMLVGRGAKDPDCREALFTNWYDVIRDEIARRGLAMHGDHPVAPQRQEVHAPDCASHTSYWDDSVMPCTCPLDVDGIMRRG